MKLNQLLSLTISSLVCIPMFLPSKILAHEYCPSYLDCQHTENLEKIDYWTNYFFKLVRPEMRHKRIRMHHTLYRRELTAIRRVVHKLVSQSCQQPQMNQYYLLLKRDLESSRQNYRQSWHRRNRINRINDDSNNNWQQYKYYGEELLWDEKLWNEGYYWQRTEDYFFEGLYGDLADAIFYARHPELSAETSIKNNFNWSTEWTFVRQYFANFEEEKFIKQHLIPLCPNY